MDMELIRLIADHLKDDALGVNAQLESLDLDDDDDYRPQEVGIFDETRDRCAREKDTPNTVPALYVHLEGIYGMKGDTIASNVARDSEAGGIPIGLRWIDRDADTVRGFQGRSYGVRAVLKSLERLATLQGETSQRNNVELISIQSITVGPWREKIGNFEASTAILVVCQARDNKP